MEYSTKLRAPVENLLLAALPRREYQRLLPELEHVTLAFTEEIYQPGERIEHVYFPNKGLIALTSPVNKRATTAVNLMGKDGMTGICVFLGEAVSPTPAIVLVAGAALRMKASVLRKESRHGPLERLLRRYTQSLLMQSQQGIICNHFHKIDARLCCWLLYIQDAAETSEFPMTHKLLSNMMGVRREEVSKAANALQQDKLISYSRGSVTILNRTELKAASCECYRISQERND
jgi:CRP-like cAMP-binding protein